MPPSGSRRRRGPWTEPTYGPNRWAWLNLGAVEIIVYSGADKSEYFPDGDEEEPTLPSYADGLGISSIRLAIRRIGRRPITLSLTYYTVKELQALKKIFNMAIDRAIERSAVLDAEAHRVSMEGNDSIPRTWRPDPQVLERRSVLTRTAGPDTVDPEPDPTD